jgi:serine/threonine-protein kinase
MIGRTLGAYRLEEAIGRGGMGVVYRATDTRLGRTVAIKVLPPGPPDETDDASRARDRTRRFLKEAQAASTLNHPNIVTLHDVGREGDVDFIVMEFLAGQTVAELIREGPLPVDRVVDIARQVADALATAHAAGIVHRDLKPQNLMMGADGRARVLDFGLARMGMTDAIDPDAMTASARLTRPGALLGTPAYMSPEQIEGNPADARSDVHAFGLILYEMLTAVQPFRESSLASTAHAIAYREPQPILGRRPDAPRPLIRLIERCLQKKPAERFAHGGELRGALQPIVRAVESGAAAPGPSLRSRLADATDDVRRAWGRWGRGRRLAAAGGTVAVIATVAWSALPGLRGAIGNRVGSAIPGLAPTPYALYQSGAADLLRYFEPARLNRAFETLKRAVVVDPQYAPGHVGLAEAYWRGFRENRDGSLLRHAMGHAREATRLDPQLASAQAMLGLVSIEDKALPEARQALEQALRLDPGNAQAHRGLGALHVAEGRTAEADSAFTHAIALAPDNWEIRIQRGVLYLGTGRHKEALADFEECARLSPDNPVVYRNIGGAQHMLGRFVDAAASFQKSIAIKPDPVVYSNLGTIYFFQGLYPQAVGAFERSVELGPNNATIWRNLADAYRQVADRGKEASRAYLRASQLLREELRNQPKDPVLTAELALCLARRGEADEARRLAATIDVSSRHVSEVAYGLVLTFEAIGDRSAALDALRAAIAAGHPIDEIKQDPELVDLRKDSAYHRLLADVRGN